jgi:hypothetical protein
MLAERVKTGPAELFSFMASTKNTFTEVNARLEAVETEQARLCTETMVMNRRIEKLEETAKKRESKE